MGPILGLAPSRNLTLAIANVVGGMAFFILRIMAVAPRAPAVRRYPSLGVAALWLLVLFFLVNLAWGAAILASPQWRRREYYGFVWIYWIVVAILGSGFLFI